MNTKGKNISEARKNAGLTMEELGKMVGVSRATIKRYESGEIANIPDDKIEKIAKATTRMIFRNENGSYSNTDSFKYASRVIHNKLGFKEFDFHSLRHTHATMLIEAGVSPKTVQERLGHEKIETTFNRYVHNTEKMQNNAVEIFDNILKSAIM